MYCKLLDKEPVCQIISQAAVHSDLMHADDTFLGNGPHLKAPTEDLKQPLISEIEAWDVTSRLART